MSSKIDIHRIYRVLFKIFRKKRMTRFESLFNLSGSTTIVDVGGDQYNWKFLRCRPLVTVINLHKPKEWDESLENFSYKDGDATQMEFSNSSFDVAFSNSVIEHLGNWENQKSMAKEICRVGRSVYVQTPAREFFFEPHVLTPFIHWLPMLWQSKLMRNFTVWGILTRPTQKYVDGFLAERRLLSFDEFQELFPDCRIARERFFFLTKSYIAIRKI